MEKCGVEIELECQCVYRYEFRAAGNEGIPIGFLIIQKCIVNLYYAIANKLHSKVVDGEILLFLTSMFGKPHRVVYQLCTTTNCGTSIQYKPQYESLV